MNMAYDPLYKKHLDHLAYLSVGEMIKDVFL